MESTEQKYRRLIARADTGEPIIELAAEAGVKPATVRWWRSELRRRDREPDHVEPASLIPVRLVSKIGSGPGEPIELVTARGRIILRPGFDESTLARLLSVLERPTC